MILVMVGEAMLVFPDRSVAVIQAFDDSTYA